MLDQLRKVAGLVVDGHCTLSLATAAWWAGWLDVLDIITIDADDLVAAFVGARD